MLPGEKDISAFKKETKKQARIFGTQKDAWRSGCAEAKTQKRPETFNARVRKRLDPKAKLLKIQSIRLNDDFRAVFKAGKRIKGSFLNLWILNSPQALSETPPKLGIIVSRKTSALATTRNLWKRRIREAFRKNQQSLARGRMFLVQARHREQVPSFQMIESEIFKLLELLNKGEKNG